MPIAYWALGRSADSNAALRRLVAAHANDNAYGIAEIHAYRGEVNAAFEWLDRAYRQRDSGMIGLKSDLLLQNVRSDPRYQVLLTKMKLSD